MPVFIVSRCRSQVKRCLPISCVSAMLNLRG
jgi:hypothetical protein